MLAVAALLAAAAAVNAFGIPFPFPHKPAPPHRQEKPQHCRVQLGDAAWPSSAQWAAFNASVGGRLVATVPLAHVCHGADFDQAACDAVRANWIVPEFHEASSSSIMSATFSNRSCDPFTAPDAQCIVGNYVALAVNASCPLDVIRTLAFAKQHDLRFVVRNTGHDYLGKSTAPGGLAVWTHHLNQTEWFTYKSKLYTGPAVKVGAGATLSQLYAEADARNLTIVGGHCPSVGYAGGFVQGGGHGPLSPLYGLAADNVLEFEVITTDGRFLSVTPSQNKDLFWALRGGGGGTYAVVWSVTSRAHPDLPVAGAQMQFAAGGNVTLDMFWEAVGAYRGALPAILAAKAQTTAVYQGGVFGIAPFMLPGGTKAQVDALLAPVTNKLTQLGIPFLYGSADFPGFFQAYSALENPSVLIVQSEQQGARMFPRAVLADAKKRGALESVIRGIVDDGAGAFDISVTRGKPKDWTPPPSAVLPQWDTTAGSFSVFVSWNFTGTNFQAFTQRQQITNQYIPALRAVTPGAGAYLNEADAFNPDWKTDYYGVNYNQLLAIKDKYDPDQRLYASTGVGGDRWAENAAGRLCAVSCSK